MTKETYINARKSNFTMVSNTLLNDKAVTLQAKGLLSIFISNDTDKFTIHMKEIITRSKNGRDAHYKVVDELIKHGYFARVEIREGGKFVEMIYIFSDDKQDVAETLKQFEGNSNAIINPDKKKKAVDNVDKSPNPESQETVIIEQKPFPENQDTEIQYTENPETENQYNNNTNLNYTNPNNTKSNNINQSISISEVYNQDIDSMYENRDMPVYILRVLNRNIDRLIDLQLSPMDILSFYKSSDNTVNESDFAEILTRAIKKDIKNFPAYMKSSIKNWYDEYEANLMPNMGEEDSEFTGTYSKDNIPEHLRWDWLNEGGNN